MEDVEMCESDEPLSYAYVFGSAATSAFAANAAESITKINSFDDLLPDIVPETPSPLIRKYKSCSEDKDDPIVILTPNNNAITSATTAAESNNINIHAAEKIPAVKVPPRSLFGTLTKNDASQSNGTATQAASSTSTSNGVLNGHDTSMLVIESDDDDVVIIDSVSKSATGAAVPAFKGNNGLNGIRSLNAIGNKNVHNVFDIGKRSVYNNNVSSHASNSRRTNGLDMTATTSAAAPSGVSDLGNGLLGWLSPSANAANSFAELQHNKRRKMLRAGKQPAALSLKYDTVKTNGGSRLADMSDDSDFADTEHSQNNPWELQQMALSNSRPQQSTLGMLTSHGPICSEQDDNRLSDGNFVNWRNGMRPKTQMTGLNGEATDTSVKTSKHVPAPAREVLTTALQESSAQEMDSESNPSSLDLASAWSSPFDIELLRVAQSSSSNGRPAPTIATNFLAPRQSQADVAGGALSMIPSDVRPSMEPSLHPFRSFRLGRNATRQQAWGDDVADSVTGNGMLSSMRLSGVPATSRPLQAQPTLSSANGSRLFQKYSGHNRLQQANSRSSVVGVQPESDPVGLTDYHRQRRAHAYPNSSRRQGSDTVSDHLVTSETVSSNVAHSASNELSADEALARNLQEQYDREVAEMLQAQMMADTRQQNAMYAHTDFQPASMFDESLVYDGRGLDDVVDGAWVVDHDDYLARMRRHHSLRTRDVHWDEDDYTGPGFGEMFTAAARESMASPPQRPSRPVQGSLGWRLGLAHRRRNAMQGAYLEGDSYETLLRLGDMLGEVKDRGMKKAEIDKIPSRKYSKRSSDDQCAGETCSVCMTDFASGEKLRTLPCSHEYHASCIDQWLKRNASCPICREYLK